MKTNSRKELRFRGPPLAAQPSQVPLPLPPTPALGQWSLPEASCPSSSWGHNHIRLSGLSWTLWDHQRASCLCQSLNHQALNSLWNKRPWVRRGDVSQYIDSAHYQLSNLTFFLVWFLDEKTHQPTCQKTRHVHHMWIIFVSGLFAEFYLNQFSFLPVSHHYIKTHPLYKNVKC